MVLGQENDDISTDQLAMGIDGGMIFDTSAGFFTTDHKCSICGGQYYNHPDCSHFRGCEYTANPVSSLPMTVTHGKSGDKRGLSLTRSV